jgi:membrane associated rhomboid family serine protease
MDTSPAPGPDGTAGVPTPAGVPTCYRHPDRQTYLSCSRCGRPACPECLRPAPVGQHCLECVREGSRGTRQATAPFGGRVVATPVVTWVLIGLNVAFWIAEWISTRVVYDLWLVNAYVAHGQFYRLISSAFLHDWGLSGFGITHILFNMWALYVVGPPLERLLGHARYLVLYLLSALGGAVLFYLLAPPFAEALGASGAIFGLFGAYFVVARRLRVNARGVVFIIVLNLAITFVIPRIAWQAHVGGLIAGGLLAAAFVYAPRRRRVLVQAAAAVALLALLVIAVVVRDGQLASVALG